MRLLFFVFLYLLSIKSSGNYVTKLPMKKTTVTESDLDILSRTIHSEADYDDVYDMYLTGSVVLNRRDDKQFPNTIEEVVYEPRQFDGVRYPKFNTRTLRTDSVAYNLLLGVGRIYDIHYFYNPDTATDTVFTRNITKVKSVKYNSKHHIFL